MKPTLSVPTLNAIIIDDEPLAHEVLIHHINNINDANGAKLINIVYQGYSAIDALKWLSENTVDLLILDIKMPELTGVELIKVLANRPQVVFVTAYQEYAVEGFELDATDYLLKPVSQERLEQAVNKVLLRYNSHLTDKGASVSNAYANHNVDTTTLNLSGAKRKVKLSDIVWFEAFGNYVKVHLDNEVLLANTSFKGLLTQLPSIDLLDESAVNMADQQSVTAQFAQVHKSFGINLTQLKQLNTDNLELKNKTIVKVGKTFRKAVRALL